MCLMCISVAKEAVSPKQFWSLYKELVDGDDPEHANGLIETVARTSDEYQIQIANGFGENDE